MVELFTRCTWDELKPCTSLNQRTVETRKWSTATSAIFQNYVRSHKNSSMNCTYVRTYVNVRYISKLCTQPQKFINELYVRAYVRQRPLYFKTMYAATKIHQWIVRTCVRTAICRALILMGTLISFNLILKDTLISFNLVLMDTLISLIFAKWRIQLYFCLQFLGSWLQKDECKRRLYRKKKFGLFRRNMQVSFYKWW